MSPSEPPKAVFVFGQAGCSHCTTYIPRFKRVAASYRNRFPIGIYDLARDGQRANDFANKLGIRGTPTTVVMTRRGGLVKHTGVLDESAIKKLLEGT